jgi:hypothetical protein|tara:strand:+ start:320 stop:580 length:261 start_codon:yes stop_codon:yes gene_type:complete
MTAEQVEQYIREDLGMEPRHDCYALAQAITDTSMDMDHDENELMYLLLENKPINSLMTHSYGFHTANGRGIIERIKSYYYEYESVN